jgi:hypothetical protein
MFSITLDGVNYTDAVEGVEDCSRTLVREWQNTSIDNILRTRFDGSLTFTGNAYCYLCSKDAICDKVDVQIFRGNDLYWSGVIYIYMVSFNHYKKTAQAEIKDDSWSAFIRSKARTPVYLRNRFTLNCEPLPLLGERLMQMSAANGAPYAGRRISWDALQAFDFIVKFLSDNQLSVQSNFLSTRRIAIATEPSITYNLVTPPGFVLLEPQRLFTPTVTFEQLFEEVRKKYPIYMEIVGNVIQIELEDQTFGNTVNEIIVDMPHDLVGGVDVERLVSVIKVGSKKTDLDNEAFRTFPSRKYSDWQEATFGNCSCENDKDNELNLVSEFVIDSNVIHEKLASTYNPNGSDIFMFEYEIVGFTPTAEKGLNPNTGITWYNDGMRNDLVVERWKTYAANCVFSIRANDIEFATLCNPLVNDPTFLCIQSPMAGNTPRTVTGIMNFVAPAMVVKDSEGTFPVLTGLPTDLLPGGANGYGINVPGYYIFYAEGIWAFTVPSNVALAQVKLSIVAYSEYAAINEIYRKTETITLTNTGSQAFVPISVLSDFVLLPIGAVVLVQWESFVDNPSPVNVQQTFTRVKFEIPEEELACFNVPSDGIAYPYTYQFTKDICPANFDLIAANKTGKIVLNGVDCWVKEVSDSFKGEGTYTLLSNDKICSQ